MKKNIDPVCGMDGKEYKMIKLLKQNSRTPITEMASILGISRITANRMLSALVERGYKSGLQWKNLLFLCTGVQGSVSEKSHKVYKMIINGH